MAAGSSAAPSIPRSCSAISCLDGARRTALRHRRSRMASSSRSSQLYGFADHGELYNIAAGGWARSRSQTAASAGGGVRARLGDYLHRRSFGRESHRRPARRLARLLHPCGASIRENGRCASATAPARDDGADAARARAGCGQSRRRARWSAAARRSRARHRQRHRQPVQPDTPSSTGTRSTSAPARRRSSCSRTRSSIALNRVTGGLGPSQILGTLDAERRASSWSIRDGILFGAGAVINTAGFLATTHDITQRRLHGRPLQFLRFPAGRTPRSSTSGTITASNAGFAALVEAIHDGALGEVRHLIHIGIGGSALGPGAGGRCAGARPRAGRRPRRLEHRRAGARRGVRWPATRRRR